MTFNLYPSLALAKTGARWLTMLVLCGLQGCLSPMALDHTVIEYDKVTTEILSKLILLNIARSHQHQPMHFTGVSNIAETFNFQFNAGATLAFTGENGSLMTPVFGGTGFREPDHQHCPDRRRGLSKQAR